MSRITLKDLKQMIKGLPDDTILICQSDSEGNESSVCLDVFVDVVGKEYTMNMDNKEYKFYGGEDYQGIDLEKDKGKTLLIFQPSL